jgi:hypothetical protein
MQRLVQMATWVGLARWIFRFARRILEEYSPPPENVEHELRLLRRSIEDALRKLEEKHSWHPHPHRYDPPSRDDPPDQKTS